MLSLPTLATFKNMFSCALCAYTCNRQKYVLLRALCLHLQQAKLSPLILSAYTYNRQIYILLFSVPTLATGKITFSCSLPTLTTGKNMFSCTLCAYTYNRQKYVLLLSVPTLATGKNMFSYSLCLHLQQAKMRSQALCAYTYIHLAKHVFSFFVPTKIPYLARCAYCTLTTELQQA